MKEKSDKGVMISKMTVDNYNPDKHWLIFQCKTTQHNIIQEFEPPTLSVMLERNGRCVNRVNWQGIIGFIDNNPNCNLLRFSGDWYSCGPLGVHGAASHEGYDTTPSPHLFSR